MDAYESIDRAIESFLKENGMTQQEFADRLGTNTNSLRWKRHGKNDWKFSEVLKVAEIIGVDADDLICSRV